MQKQQEYDRLVWHFVNKYRRYCSAICDADDLFQAGRIGVLLAERTYNPNKGTFSSWAAFYIRKEIRNALSIQKEKPIIESLQKPVDDEETLSIEDSIADESVDVEYEQLKRQGIAYIRTAVRECVEGLRPGRKAAVVGIDLEGRPAAEVAKDAGCTVQNVYRWRQDAICELRSNSRMIDIAKELDIKPVCVERCARPTFDHRKPFYAHLEEYLKNNDPPVKPGDCAVIALGSGSAKALSPKPAFKAL